MQPGRHAVPAKQHQPKEGRFQEEGGQNLETDERGDHIAHHMGIAAPVGSELVGQDDAGHHAHGEADGEDLGPVARQTMEDVALGDEPDDLKRGDERRQTDREARKDDVKENRKGELCARE